MITAYGRTVEEATFYYTFIKILIMQRLKYPACIADSLYYTVFFCAAAVSAAEKQLKSTSIKLTTNRERTSIAIRLVTLIHQVGCITRGVYSEHLNTVH